MHEVHLVFANKECLLLFANTFDLIILFAVTLIIQLLSRADSVFFLGNEGTHRLHTYNYRFNSQISLILHKHVP